MAGKTNSISTVYFIMNYKFFLPVLALSLILTQYACNTGNTIVEAKELDYPSSSGIEYADGKFYVIGDDATNLLIIDSNLNAIDSVSLYNYPERRIPKHLKEDLESIAISPDGLIWLFGSGSSPLRHKYWKLNLATEKMDVESLLPLYESLKQKGLTEINIEGAAFIPGYLILANRGHNNYKANHLVIIEEKTLADSANCKFSVASLTSSKTDNPAFSGISGLCYVKEDDILICTASTEQTNNSIEDGEIGKSFLWIIKNISQKSKAKEINIDTIIDLEGLDSQFKGNKIESVCLLAKKEDSLHLLLVADNDKGNSTLFKLTIKID